MAYLVKRPVAFRVPRADPSMAGEMLGTEWRLIQDEEAAHEAAEEVGAEYQALFVRDGTAIVGEWEPIETAPREPKAMFLVCAVGDDRGPFVVRADILWRARAASTPSHLEMRYLTHWMPLPAMPVR